MILIIKQILYIKKSGICLFERWFFMTNTLVCIDVYTISEGDTLYSIAEKYELPVSLLMME